MEECRLRSLTIRRMEQWANMDRGGEEDGRPWLAARDTQTGLQQRDEQEVAGGGIDDHLERAGLAEELGALVGLVAGDGLAGQDLEFLVHHAEGDTLLVEVGADEVHRGAPGLGKQGNWENSSSLPQAQGIRKPSRRPSPPSHSFNPRVLEMGPDRGPELGLTRTG
jgi:hypothetical protein